MLHVLHGCFFPFLYISYSTHVTQWMNYEALEWKTHLCWVLWIWNSDKEQFDFGSVETTPCLDWLRASTSCWSNCTDCRVSRKLFLVGFLGTGVSAKETEIEFSNWSSKAKSCAPGSSAEIQLDSTGCRNWTNAPPHWGHSGASRFKLQKIPHSKQKALEASLFAVNAWGRTTKTPGALLPFLSAVGRWRTRRDEVELPVARGAAAPSRWCTSSTRWEAPQPMAPYGT